MTGFSAQWLALREPADHRARHSGLQQQACSFRQTVAHREQRAVRIIDLGCGSGSNLRALAPYLPSNQRWTLIDYDPLLLSCARQSLIAWADSVISAEQVLAIIKNDRRIDIEFEQLDLARDIEQVLARPADLITAAAFFDLVAEDWLGRFCKGLRTVLYTVLTYDGNEKWTPAHANDTEILRAFHAHQKTDKGFGIAAGPDATSVLERTLGTLGFKVTLATSPWSLQRDEASLMTALATGSAAAVRETGLVHPQALEQWLSARITAESCQIGHRDILAIPARLQA